jgi:hypothetical protein
MKVPQLSSLTVLRLTGRFFGPVVPMVGCSNLETVVT